MSKDKSKTENVSKSDAELRELHAQKVEHNAMSVEKWLQKLAKSMKSRRYSLNEGQTKQVLDYLAKATQEFANRISSEPRTEAPRFKLK